MLQFGLNDFKFFTNHFCNFWNLKVAWNNKIINSYSVPPITQSVQCSDFRESTGGSQCSVVVEFFMLDNLRNIRKNLFSSISEASSMILLYGACDRTLLLAMGHWSSVLHRHRWIWPCVPEIWGHLTMNAQYSIWR